MKTSELTEAALDWAVAMCEEVDVTFYTPKLVATYCEYGRIAWRPSSRWDQGGPIIERKRIEIKPTYAGLGAVWAATCVGGFEMYGPTPLIAAMRCLVASKLGEEVEVPEALL